MVKTTKKVPERMPQAQLLKSLNTTEFNSYATVYFLLRLLWEETEEM